MKQKIIASEYVIAHCACCSYATRMHTALEILRMPTEDKPASFPTLREAAVQFLLSQIVETDSSQSLDLTTKPS